MMKVQMPKIVYENKARMRKWEWRAALLRSVKGAFKRYGAQYQHVAADIWKYLDSISEGPLWSVFAYPKASSNAYVGEYLQYIYKIQCRDLKSGCEHMVLLFDCEEICGISKQLFFDPLHTSSHVTTVINKSANIDEQLILATLAPYLLLDGETNAESWNALLQEFSPDSRYLTIRCKQGAYIGGCYKQQYYICQYHDYVYACFQIR